MCPACAYAHLTKGGHTDCVNGLMDHNLTELELLMLAVPNILRDHRAAIHIHRIRTRSAIRPSVLCARRLWLVIIVQCRNVGRLANASVTLSARLVMLPP